jgi:hypothetical protein
MSYPAVIVKYMFDTDRSSSIFAAVSPPSDVAASPAGPARVPLERLEAQICELAGHLAATTCRFLVYEPEDCDELIRQYLEHGPGAPAPP